MKYSVLVILVFIMVGCSTDKAHQNAEDQLILELIVDKMYKNMPSMYCEQPGYLACYGITQGQCLTEISEANFKCIEKVKVQFGEISGENFEHYIDYYATCLLFMHSTKHPDNVAEIRMCLDRTKMDDEKARRSMFK